MENLEELWEKITDHFEQILVPASFKHWIKQAKIVRLDHNYLYIQVPTETHKAYWEDNLSNDLMNLGYNYLRRPFDPKFIVQEDSTETFSSFEPALNSIDRTVGNPTDHFVFDSNLNPKYTFDNFIIGKGSQMAHAAALVVCEKPGTYYNPLFFYGGVGLGKTHLMQAIGNYYKQLHPEARIKYVTSESFTNDLITSIQKKTQEEFRNNYRSIDLLLVDDIQFLAAKEATQEEFFHTFNELYNAGKQIVLTSDRQPREINSLQDRLVSRFTSGLPVDITPPDLETRIAILAKKAETIGIDITTDTLSYIAGQIDSNVRELEGALVRVQAYSVTRGEDITTNLAAEALSNYLTNGEAKVVSILNIQQTVAKYYQITVEDLKGKKRTKNIVEPRQIAMYLSRELTNSSLPKIGTEFGGKDHTTVIHAYEKISEAMKGNGLIKAAVSELTQQLNR